MAAPDMIIVFKFLPWRIEADGLNHAKELYTLESVSKHNAFTSIQVKTHVNQIHKIGLKYIEKLEEYLHEKES